MSDIFDQLGKRLSQGIDRAKFEAEKFQKTARVQGELSDVKRQFDSKMIELGQRAYDLQRSGHISSPSIDELCKAIDELRANLVEKEEELKALQTIQYIEPSPSSQPAPQPGANTAEPSMEPSVAAPPPPPPPPPASSPAPTPAVPPQPAMAPSSGPTIMQSNPEPDSQPAAGTEAKKTCSNCGFQMPLRAVFCPNCGRQVGESS
jgi:hypothetical protein